MYQPIQHSITTQSDLAVDSNTDYNLATIPVYGCSIQAVYGDATPGAQSFVAADVTINPANTITIPSHGFSTGLKVALTGTNLPSGLSTTDYWVIVVNSNTIKLASSLTNASSGIPVTISTQGTTADAMLTPASLGGVIVKLQMSNDGINFTDISGKTVTISSPGSVLWDLGATTFRVLRVNEAANSGAIDLTLNFNSINNF